MLTVSAKECCLAYKFPENGMCLWNSAPPPNSWRLMLGDERGHLKNAEPLHLTL